jgi:hypothetical protein
MAVTAFYEKFVAEWQELTEMGLKLGFLKESPEGIALLECPTHEDV